MTSPDEAALIPTAPPSSQDRLLREKLIEEIAGQSERMDQLARQLISLELAIPGLYATVLPLRAGEHATPLSSFVFQLSLICWGLALALSLISLVPRRYKVDSSRLLADKNSGSAGLSIEAFFRCSAVYKRWLLIPSCLLFFAGVMCAVIGLP